MRLRSSTPLCKFLRSCRLLSKGKPLYPIVALAVASGARRSELLALQWRDVDYVKATVKIERQLEQTGAPACASSRQRAKNGKRTITLAGVGDRHVEGAPAPGARATHAFRHGQSRARRLTSLATTQGRPIPPNSLSIMWRKATLPLGLDVKLHSLRHSHASALIAAGIDPITVSRRLGHASASFTLHCYGHLL